MVKEIDIKNGYIILSHTLGWAPISWSIRRLTESVWDHAGQAVVDGDDSVYVIEAEFKGVVKTPIAEYVDPKKYIVKIVALREEAFKDKAEYERAIDTATDFLREKVGYKYDKRAVLWLALSYTILAIFRRSKNNPLEDRKKFYCFELICASFRWTSSIVTHLFAGLKHPEATCSTVTGKDISKSVNVSYIAGVDKN